MVGSPGRLVLAFTPAALMTASLAGPTTTLHLPYGCTFLEQLCCWEGALKASFSTDNGNTWTLRTVSIWHFSFATLQITGDMSGNGTIIAGMDEGGGGFPHNNVNHIYRSTDGGNTWMDTYSGLVSRPGVGQASGYFACMFTGSPSVFTGGTRAGVSLPPSTTWFTWSMPSTARAVTRRRLLYPLH